MYSLMLWALLAQVRVADLGWMAGHWVGTAAEEHWLAPKAGLMLGVSRTVMGERVTGFEFLRIEERADGVFYVAQPGGRPPTLFRLTKSSGKSVVFENPEHDFPKVIRYRLEDDATLVAVIEGDGKQVEFRFKRE